MTPEPRIPAAPIETPQTVAFLIVPTRRAQALPRQHERILMSARRYRLYAYHPAAANHERLIEIIHRGTHMSRQQIQLAADGWDLGARRNFDR